MNIDILGISEPKWTGMGEFNSDDHYIYHHGQESFRRNGVASIVNKRVQNAVLGCNLRNNTKISVHFQGKPFNIRVFQVSALTSNAEEAEVEQFYEDLQDLLELTPPPKKMVTFPVCIKCQMIVEWLTLSSWATCVAVRGSASMILSICHCQLLMAGHCTPHLQVFSPLQNFLNHHCTVHLLAVPGPNALLMLGVACWSVTHLELE